MRRLIGLVPLLHALPLLAYLLLRASITNSVPDVVPERQWWRLYNLVSLLNEFTPFYFLPLPLWLLTAAIARTRSALFASAVPWLMFASLYGDLFVPRPVHVAEWLGRAPPGETRLRVMTFNVFAASRPTDELVGIIAEAHPDVLLTQELVPSLAQALDAELKATYPYSRLRTSGGWGAQGIWSRYPIVSEEVWDGSRREAQWQHAVLNVDGQPVHVVSLHLTTPSVNWRVRQDWPVPVAVGQMAQARSLEVTWLVPRLRPLVQGPEPLIVAGDLNLTDQTPEFQRLLDTGLTSAYRQAGWGFGLTFPATPRVRFFRRTLRVPTPLVGIDHILLSPRVAARRALVWPEAAGSDHRPVVADLVLRSSG